MMMATIIVQARMGSTRLPGKVLRPIMGRPMFSYQLERLRAARRVERIVVATTTAPADAAIVDFCASEKVPCVPGSEADVLSRYALAAADCDAHTIVRVTSDCPLIEPELVDYAIQEFTASYGAYHYVSNMLHPTWPYGMAVEVFSRAVLDEANREALQPAEREHVTPFIYWRPERYRLKSLQRQPDLSQHRWTVDTPEDFELICRILEALYPNNPRFTLHDVLALLALHPAWAEINRHVQQKTVSTNS